MSENDVNNVLNEIDELLDSCIADIYNDKDNKIDNTIEVSNIVSPQVGNQLSDGTKVEPSLVVHGEGSSQAQETESDDGRIKWDDDVIALFNEKFPNKDIYNMDLDELKHLRDDVEALREEFSLVEQAYKVLSNGAYGASANAKGFYFYNLSVAGDITGECRALTKYFWTHLEEFFHETIWERKDLWEQFGFELDESKRELCRSLPVSCYSDTDSVTGDSIIYIKEGSDNDLDNLPHSISFNSFYELLKDKYKCEEYENENGQMMIAVPDNIKVLNVSYYNSKEFKFVPIRYLMRHKVSKPIYTIVTESGKSVRVTADHSCIVVRNGKQITVDTSEIDIENDKIITCS